MRRLRRTRYTRGGYSAPGRVRAKDGEYWATRPLQFGQAAYKRRINADDWHPLWARYTHERPRCCY
jgi:hypothetical protein